MIRLFSVWCWFKNSFLERFHICILLKSYTLLDFTELIVLILAGCFFFLSHRRPMTYTSTFIFSFVTYPCREVSHYLVLLLSVCPCVCITGLTMTSSNKHTLFKVSFFFLICLISDHKRALYCTFYIVFHTFILPRTQHLSSNAKSCFFFFFFF